jgi:hypothetical protein
MTRLTVKALALLLLASLAACATGGTNTSMTEPSRGETGRDFADAIMAGMERARAMRDVQSQHSTAEWP